MKTITKNQHLQLVGLLTLAGRHMKMLRSISESALSITGEKEDDGTPATCGHTSDAIWDDNQRDADALLERLKIKVRK
jgi:hypothetical protein